MSTPGNSAAHLCHLLGIDRPVLAAPMANISGGVLANAVSRAGGLGFIGGGYGDPHWIDREIAIGGSSRLGVGLITWNMAEGALKIVLSHQPAAVWLSFGDPDPHIGTIHEAGALAICQVGTVGEAVAAAAAGADVVVAQGSEAGGHGRLDRTLADLVPAISAAVPDVPLVAAGGINDRHDLVAVQALGAAGVALGSALYATPEALDADAAKQLLVRMGGDDTVRSTVYDLVRGPEWPAGYVGRSIRTELTDEWTGREGDLRAVTGPLIARHNQAIADSDVSFRVVWAGEGIGDIDRIRPAAEIVRRFPLAHRTTL